MTEHAVDPFRRADILEWLKREDFLDVGHGYWEKCYSLSHSYPAMRVGIPEGQICATVALTDAPTTSAEDNNMRTVYLGEAYTLHPIAALWAVLNLFDYDQSRDMAYWRDYHERRCPLEPKVQA